MRPSAPPRQPTTGGDGGGGVTRGEGGGELVCLSSMASISLKTIAVPACTRRARLECHAGGMR